MLEATAHDRLGCCNKLAETEQLINDRKLFLQVLKARKSQIEKDGGASMATLQQAPSPCSQLTPSRPVLTLWKGQ